LECLLEGDTSLLIYRYPRSVNSLGDNYNIHSKTRKSIDVCNIIRLWVSILKGKVFAKRKIKICRKVKQNKCKNNGKLSYSFQNKNESGFLVL